MALLWWGAARAAPAADWTVLETSHFTFVGDASERQIRRVAQKLEQFREVVGRIVPWSAGPSPVPTVVVVFSDQRAFRPYMPRFQGRVVESAGYLAGAADAAYIALSADPDFEALTFQTIFHEYAHYLTAVSGIDLPPWASEGMAQVWETVADTDGGRAAIVGRADKTQVDLLRGSTLIPLRDLRAVGHDSPLYNEGSRRSVFYAQSWGLMHYLMFGNRERAAQLQTFLGGLRRGVDAEQAFAEAFGADDRALERELFDYLRKFTFPAVRYEFDTRIDTAVTGRGTRLADAEAEGYLGELLARTRRADEARTRLTAARKTSPSAVRPAVALGLLELREGKTAEALLHLEDALTHAPDDGPALAALGQALIERADEQTGTAGAPLRARAREVLSRAVALDGAASHVVATLALLERDEGNFDRAVTLLERALQQSPTRDDYRLMAAEILVRQRRFDRVSTFVGPVLAAGRSPEARARARQLLVSAADGQAAAAVSAGPAGIAEAPAAAEAPGIAAPPATAAAPPPSPPERAAGVPAGLPSAAGARGTRYILDLRAVAAGETRVLGMFRGIECTAGAAVILADTEAGLLRVRAERLETVEFISYRAEPGTVECGSRPAPARALITYRPDAPAAAGSHGVAVAVELVPDDYVPR
jgi:tetratricopeptide (TPR) repeat protein